MATKTPESQPKTHLVPEDLRAFVTDNMVENNLLDLDLTWSDEEIMEAMRRCAMMWNGIPPVVDSLRVTSQRLPYEYAFLVGTAYQMYLSKLMLYQRNDIDYDIGGVQTNTFKARIKHFTNMMQVLKDEFLQLGSEMKLAKNLDNAYGLVG